MTCTGKKCRTPAAWYCVSAASTSPAGHGARTLHPNGWSTSIPRTTASLPALISSRACVAEYAMRYQPFPGPPDCVSMKASRSFAAMSWRSTASMSSQVKSGAAPFAPQRMALLTAVITIRRRPPS